MTSIAYGIAAGIAATGPMTIVIGAGKALGLLGTPPPKQITAQAQKETGTRDDVRGPAFTASWLAVHLGCGGGCGTLYATTRSALSPSDLAAGLTFGGAVWAASYGAVMLELGH